MVKCVSVDVDCLFVPSLVSPPPPRREAEGHLALICVS